MLDFSFFVENRLRRHNTALRPTRHPVVISGDPGAQSLGCTEGAVDILSNPLCFHCSVAASSQAVLGYLGMS
jgi:hypothetical protein